MTERTKPADTTEENDESGKDGAQQIVDFGSALTKTPHGSVYCMTIIGQIEGHNTAASGAKTTKYEHVLPLLAKLEESDEVNGVLFLLNTVGGDVEAGLAIAELIAGMTKPTVSIVLGGSHSIGVPLAVAARRSFAVPSAAMTIHPVRMSGTVIAAPQTYNYFQRLQDRIVAFVSSHSQITAQRNVRFFAFSLVMAEGVEFENSREKQFLWLQSQGFETVEYRRVTACLLYTSPSPRDCS